MDRLWSPWRAQHVATFAGDPHDDGRSIFARIGAADRDRENLVVWRGAHVYAVLNRFPYTNGHLLLVPYREVDAYDALTADERHELADASAKAVGWLRAALGPDGFNVGMNLGSAGGAGIPGHLHLHVVPRWTGDTNFMPVVGEAKVVPEALDVTYGRLRAVLTPAEAATTRDFAADAPDRNGPPARP